MDYYIVTVHLKDGQKFPQAVVRGGSLTKIRHHNEIPFTENDIDHFEITHDKWDWRSET
jgi:hypothetical protein